jgi:DNA invertase Pin-like site-specific DNA recombinase
MNPRKQKPFRAGKEVKRRARREIGSPPPTQRHESRKRKPPKHKQRELQIAEDGA